MFRPSATARSPTRRRTSSSRSTVFEERFYAGGAGLRPPRLAGKDSLRRLDAGGPHDAVANEPRQTAIVIRRAAMRRRAAFETVDQGAQVVLRVGNAGLLHKANSSSY